MPSADELPSSKPPPSAERPRVRHSKMVTDLVTKLSSTGPHGRDALDSAVDLNSTNRTRTHEMDGPGRASRWRHGLNPLGVLSCCAVRRSRG